MTEQAGYMNEADLIDEISSKMWLSKGKSDEGDFPFLGDIIDYQPNSQRLILRAATMAALSVLQRRGLLNELGLELIKQSGEAK